MINVFASHWVTFFGRLVINTVHSHVKSGYTLGNDAIATIPGSNRKVGKFCYKRQTNSLVPFNTILKNNHLWDEENCGAL